MLRHSLLVVAGLSLAACHVSFGSAPPSSSSSTAKAPSRAPANTPSQERAAEPAPAKDSGAPDVERTSPETKKGKKKKNKKKKGKQAVRTNPKKKGDKPVRTNPKKKGGKQAVRTNPKKGGKDAIRTNPKKKGGKKPKRTSPKKKGKRVSPVVPTDVASGIHVTCNFEDGWVAVLPADVYDPGEEYLMQALIGLRGDPGFWGGLSQYEKYEPYKAQECKDGPIDFDLEPGSYVIAVGMANQFFVRGEYRDNGYLEEVELSEGAGHDVVLGEADLSHTWLCISCPFLVVFQDGKEFEAGQVLKDRYTRRRYGTDVVETQADVRDGVLTLRLDEREPEVSYIDAVTVSVGGTLLPLVDDGPKAIRAMDDDSTSIRMGDSVVLEFDAAGIPDGLVDVEIRVSGHYEAIGPLL